MTSTNNASDKPAAAPITVGDYNKVLLAAYRSAQNAITSAALTLRLIGHEEGSNDSLSVAVADLERIRAVVAGRADSLASAVQSRTATTTDTTNHKPAAAPTSDKPVAVESKPAAESVESVPAPFSLTNVSTSALEKMSVTRYTETALEAWCTSRGTTTPPMDVFVASVKDELSRRKPLRGGVETSPPAPVVLASTASKSAKEEAQIKAANPPVAPPAAPKPATPAPVKVAWRLQGSESVLLCNGHALRVKALPSDKFAVTVDGVELRVISWVSHPKSMEATRNELYAMACTVAADHANSLKTGKATEEDINPLSKPAAAPVAVPPSKPASVASCIVDETGDDELDAISDEEREALADESADETHEDGEGIAMRRCDNCGIDIPHSAKFCGQCGERQGEEVFQDSDSDEEDDTPPVKPVRKPAATPVKPAAQDKPATKATRARAKELGIKGHALPSIKEATLLGKIAEAQAAQAKASKPAKPAAPKNNGTTARKPSSAPAAPKQEGKPAAPTGLKRDSNQGRVLAYLASTKRGCTAALIASETGNNWPSDVVKTCAALVALGYVESDKEDRNGRDVTVFTITAEGKAALKSAK